MLAPTTAEGGHSAARLLKQLALLWLAGIALRATILAVPPVIPLIHDGLHMTETQVGLLIGLPLMMFAIAAIPGSLLIARFGAYATMIVGMLITAIAGAARGGAPNVLTLCAATVLMGFGVAIMQPALPTLVRAWTPSRIGIGTAFSTNGMMVGVALGPALTIPVVLPLVGQSWRLDFLVWSAPVLAAAVLFLLIAPKAEPTTPAQDAMPQQWWPDWKNPVIWLLGLTFGSNNALYYCVNAFLPDYLNSVGRGHLVAAAVGWLNVAQFIASLLLLFAADRLQHRSWPYLVFGPAAIAGVFGVVLGDGYGIVLAAALIGFSLAMTFVVTLALPPVLSLPQDIHRVAGGMFTISYTCAVIVPVIAGALWDFTEIAWTAFLPAVLCGLSLTTLGLFLSRRGSVLMKEA